jgi:hypothetical protein
MDPKPQDEEPVELDEELSIEDDDDLGEPDEDEILKEYGL